MKTIFTFLTLLITFNTFAQTNSSETQLIKSKNHPIQYYLSLPKGWNKKKQWPVVIILEAADKEYKKNLDRFITARGDMPFILIAPFNTNNGNQGRRDPKLFPYSTETWDYMDKVGDCQFNDDGIQNIIKEVSANYNGEQKIYITGFEAGTHVLWSIVFNHPEWLKAAASVAGNFRNRCVEPSKISNALSKQNLQIKSFVGEKDEYFAPSGKVYNQWTEVKSLATSHGFENISETVLPDKGHVPMPDEVMSYFNSLLKK
jgi:predicted peptidase